MTRVFALALVVGLLLSGCSTDLTAAPTATRTPVITPSPTETGETAARVPFDGDCASAVPSDRLTAIFDGQVPTPRDRSAVDGVMPDVAASLARIGGLVCTWQAQGSRIGSLTVAAIPTEQVPAGIIDAYAEFGCYGWGVCGRGESQSGTWVFAEAPRWGAEGDLSTEEAEALPAAIDTAIDSLFARPAEMLSAVPAATGDDWWTLPDCEVLEPAVTSAAGMSAPEAGYPSDNVPGGPLWEVLTETGVVAWCPWYEYSGTDSIITELQLQSGVGAPTPEQLVAVAAQPITVDGADAAYRIDDGAGAGSRTVEVLAIVGPNRLLVGGDSPEIVAAAALATLGP